VQDRLKSPSWISNPVAWTVFFEQQSLTDYDKLAKVEPLQQRLSTRHSLCKFPQFRHSIAQHRRAIEAMEGLDFGLYSSSQSQ